MTAELRAMLSPAALRVIDGTDLEFDAEKLEQLAQVVLEEQEQVVRAHLSIRLPWDEALVGKTLRSDTQATSTEPPELPKPPPVRRMEERKVEALKPNRFNAALFPDSLSEASIRQIADDLERHGQRVPVEVTPDDVITDGERRWRGAKLLGWKTVDVVVTGELSDEEVLDRVLDACTSSRQMSIREQVNVYTAVCEKLKREAGREQGRPSGKTFQKGNVFLTPSELRDVAAKRAGFSSAALALRANAIFSRGSNALQAKVLKGTISISAAYDEMPKGSQGENTKSTALKPEPSDVAPNSQGAGQDAPDAAVEDSGSTSTGPGDAGDVRSEDSAVDDTSANTEAGESDDADTDADEDDVQDDEAGEGNEPQALAWPAATEAEVDVDEHVRALCGHVSTLREQNYDDAVAFFDQVVEQMRDALGEQPEEEAGNDGNEDFADFDES